MNALLNDSIVFEKHLAVVLLEHRKFVREAFGVLSQDIYLVLQEFDSVSAFVLNLLHSLPYLEFILFFKVFFQLL